ncbi:hypothetical protein Toil_gp06 [Rhodococcus phage Toil]|uniref:Uncharacterized protein n=1 Tax=Rhodococcus phage Toil TaxID=1975614 RepID=A0A1W6DXS9_9VIRU|nr:hypothetical protein KMD62_gp06 [Rhodococcus phage Toil]ARK07689.1 hypothetical protein Toil_gp06 [Rhodococcus phage Toil]
MKVSFECSHSLEMHIVPRFGDRLWCRDCDTYRSVTHVDVWIFNCSDCKYSRRLATSGRALAIAEEHANRNGHTLKVKNPGGVVSYIVSPDTIPML